LRLARAVVEETRLRARAHAEARYRARRVPREGRVGARLRGQGGAPARFVRGRRAEGVEMTAGPLSTGEQIVTDAIVHLEDIVDRDALADVCKSIHTLFGIGVRVYS